ncbi:MAG: hypothetical protein VYA92_03220 [Actinomycetota bacterium]|nr:hypothetical protein [Actinomycetota bacterium]
MSQVESDVQVGSNVVVGVAVVVVGVAVVVVGVAVVVVGAESDPLAHAEATNRDATAIVYFLTD